MWCTVLSFGGTGYRIQRFQWLGICIIVFALMPPINPAPSSVPQGYVDSYGSQSEVWRVYHFEGYYDMLANRSSVIGDPLGEPGHTPLYVGLPSTWASMDSDHMFSPISWESSLTGDSDRYK